MQAFAPLARADEPPWLHHEVARRMAERLAIIRVASPEVLDWWGWLGAGAVALAQAYPGAARAGGTDRGAARRSGNVARPWWSRWQTRWQSNAPRVLLGELAGPRAAAVGQHDAARGGRPPALFARWQQALAVDGFVMFSCLGPGTLRELRALYERLGWGAATPTSSTCTTSATCSCAASPIR